MINIAESTADKLLRRLNQQPQNAENKQPTTTDIEVSVDEVTAENSIINVLEWYNTELPLYGQITEGELFITTRDWSEKDRLELMVMIVEDNDSSGQE
jgi:hypothetical protein